MCARKATNEPWLFDNLMQEIDRVTNQYDTSGVTDSTEVLPKKISSDNADGTGRKACNSVGHALAIASLGPGLRKRYIGPTKVPHLTNEERDDVAVLEFLEDNARCREFNNSAFPSGTDVFSQLVLDECRVLLAVSLDANSGSVLNLESVAAGLRTGPGSSSGVSGEASMYGRLCEGPMTFGSPDAASVYKACILSTRLMATTEAIRLSLYGDRDSCYTYATFLSVPKTNLKNRGICTQPSGNMALQLATHEILSEALLKDFGCNLETQQNANGVLARIGSCGRRSWRDASWEHCTLDLSRASNFPWLLIQKMFPLLWVEWLDLIRSHVILVRGTPIVKSMCSSMGNGFTFSLMTILLSAIVKVLYSLAGLPEYDVHPVYGCIKTWAVYGDDIIVDKSVVGAIKKVLASFGFLYNDKKSCTEGLFRESCGQDYYDGYPTRPVFVETLQTQTDIYSLLNRLVIWSATHSVDLRPACDVLRRALEKDYLRVPNWEDVSAGLHVPFTMSVHKPQNVPSSISDLLNKGNVPYECYMASPKIRILEREYVRKRYYSDVGSREKLSFDYVYKVKTHAKNLPGMLYCVLAGSVRVGTYGVRPSGSISYKKRWRIAPGWGDPSLYDSVAVRLRPDAVLAVYRHWEMAAINNLRGTLRK